MKKLFVLMGLLVGLNPVYAQEAETETEAEAEESPWSGEIALGYLSSAGNTDTSSATGRIKVGYTKGKWDHEIEAKGYGSSEDEGTTAESYQVAGKSIRNFTDKQYGWGQVEWKKNRFSAYETQTFETLGYGYRFLNDDVFTLNGEVGLGYSQQKKFVSKDPDETEDEDNATYTVGGNFAWNISETSTLEQILSSNTTSDNTYWESVTRLRLDIVKDLKLAVGYTVQGNTDVDGDTEKTDRYTAITLDYVW
ncbi:MAG: DUF481 domain-containing protein [Gammaproteobacteria bacterium]